MAGIYPKNLHGPLTYTASAVVLGGQLVTVNPTVAGTVRPAGAAETIILGVANADARPYVESEAYPTTVYGAQSMDASVPGDVVSVGHIGVYRLQASGAVAFGALVQPAAEGRVASHSGGQVVGRCVEASGIASGERGAVLLMLLGAATVTTVDPGA